MERNKIMLCIMLLLSGCVSKENEITFSDDRTIQVGSDFNSCTLVLKVGDRSITKFDYDGNRILVNDRDTVICPYIDTSKIGKKEIKFKYQDREYMIDVTIVDNEAPTLKCDNQEIHITIGKSIDELMKCIEISDYDEEVKVNVTGVDFNKAGSYTAEITATDSSGNTSDMNIIVVVEEEKTEISKENDIKQREEQINAKQEKPKPSGQVPSQNKENSEKVAKAENKRFLFSDGYDYTSCYDAALQYAKDIMSKGLAKGYTCEPIKSGKEYIGYEVVFK